MHHTFNQHSTSKAKVLYGGIGVLLSTGAMHQCNESGVNPTGLGQWSWSKFACKGGMIVRIITAYRPVQDRSNRPGTIFLQQEKHFANQKQSKNPRTAILEDLGVQIKKWIQ